MGTWVVFVYTQNLSPRLSLSGLFPCFLVFRLDYHPYKTGAEMANIL